MFKAFQAAFAIKSHDEVTRFLVTNLKEAGIELPLQTKDYVSFCHIVNLFIESLPEAKWTKADYSQPHMINAWLVNFEADTNIKVQEVLKTARAFMDVHPEESEQQIYQSMMQFASYHTL